ncbi:MAG: ABC transporter permease, partial [Pseudomonadota bacterium]
MWLDIKLLWRDWRGGQLSLIISSLILAVTVVTAVSLLADRIERGLSDQVSAFLAADIAVRSGIDLTPEFAEKASELGLEQAKTATFVSMLFSADPTSEVSHLAAIKAVQPTYPLRGLVEVVDSFEDQTVQFRESGPAIGEVWVEPRLLSILDLEVGDPLEVGFAVFTITKLIANEPDRGTGFTSAGARVMMHYDDLESTGLIRPGSRVNNRLLLAGDIDALDAYQAWFEEQDQQSAGQQSHYRLETAEG